MYLYTIVNATFANLTLRIYDNETFNFKRVDSKCFTNNG